MSLPRRFRATVAVAAALSGMALLTVPAPAADGRAVPQPGVYVLALYHDENGNQKFDRTGIGLPADGYGFSHNPSTRAGLPSFRSVRLAVPSSGLATRVHMKYP